jgi:hypothetical protein
MPTPSSRHVARLIAHLTDAGSTSATNRELAAVLGVTPRSIRYGIADALLLGLVGVERRAPVPGVAPSGRTITLAWAQR